MITPKCKTGQVERYVSSSGHYFPCCLIANLPDVLKLQKFLGSHFDELSLSGRTPAEIEASQAWRILEASWQSDQPFLRCAFYCSGQFQDSAKNTTDRSKVYRG